MFEDKARLLGLATLAQLAVGKQCSGIGTGKSGPINGRHVGLPEDLRLPFPPPRGNPAAPAPERARKHHSQLPGDMHHRQQVAGQKNARRIRLLKVIRRLRVYQHQQRFQRQLLGRAAGRIADQALIHAGQVQTRIVMAKGYGHAQVHQREKIVLQLAFGITCQNCSLERCM